MLVHEKVSEGDPPGCRRELVRGSSVSTTSSSQSVSPPQ
jgi:hypothetical protein